MLYLSVPQHTRLKLSLQVPISNMSPSDILTHTTTAMDEAIPGAINVPLTFKLKDTGIDIWIIHLPAAMISRIRSSPFIRGYISSGSVTIVIVGASEFTASIVPPTNVAYLDTDGSPVICAIQLTASIRDTILKLDE